VLLLILSNLIDVLIYMVWKLSGFPASRVIKFDTNLDSSRLQFLLAEHLDVNANGPGRIYYSSTQCHYRGFAP
jgi:L-lactate dehydrogenase